MVAKQIKQIKEISVEAIRRETKDKLLNDSSRMKKFSEAFREGFNNKPWHVYEWNMSRKEAHEEFTKLVSAVLSDSKGKVISVSIDGVPAGFSVVCDMPIFSRAAASMRSGDIEKAEDYKDINRQLKTYQDVTEKRGHSLDNTGYIADLVTVKEFRRRGIGTILINESVVAARENRNTAVLAWTVNPIMERILSAANFELIPAVGRTGRGIDFAVDEKTGKIIPTVAVPGENYSKVFARHYLLDLEKELRDAKRDESFELLFQ